MSIIVTANLLILLGMSRKHVRQLSETNVFPFKFVEGYQYGKLLAPWVESIASCKNFDLASNLPDIPAMFQRNGVTLFTNIVSENGHTCIYLSGKDVTPDCVRSPYAQVWFMFHLREGNLYMVRNYWNRRNQICSVVTDIAYNEFGFPSIVAREDHYKNNGTNVRIDTERRHHVVRCTYGLGLPTRRIHHISEKPQHQLIGTCHNGRNVRMTELKSRSRDATPGKVYRITFMADALKRAAIIEVRVNVRLHTANTFVYSIRKDFDNMFTSDIDVELAVKQLLKHLGMTLHGVKK